MADRTVREYHEDWNASKGTTGLETLRVEWGQQLVDLASLIETMGRSMIEDDKILGAISGQGIANHLAALPKHIRDVFLEYASDDAAVSIRDMLDAKARRDASRKATEHDWRTDITMPDDDTQTLADVLAAMRENNLQRQAAFVEWISSEWYDLAAELQWRDEYKPDLEDPPR